MWNPCGGILFVNNLSTYQHLLTNVYCKRGLFFNFKLVTFVKIMQVTNEQPFTEVFGR